MKLVSVSKCIKDGIVTRSNPMDADIIIAWVNRAKLEYSDICTYHIETEDGEIYNG